MAVSDAQKRAAEKYRRAKVKQIAIRFFPGDEDIYEHVRSQPNMAG